MDDHVDGIKCWWHVTWFIYWKPIVTWGSPILRNLQRPKILHSVGGVPSHYRRAPYRLKSVCFIKEKDWFGWFLQTNSIRFYPSSVRSQVWVISMLMNRRQAQSIIVSFFFRFPARCDNDAGLTSFDMYQWNIWNAVQLVATCGLFDRLVLKH